MSELPSFTLSCHPACPSSGAHALNSSSKPTLAELDAFIVNLITDGGEQVLLNLENDSFGDPVITIDEFYDGLIAAATIVSCLGRSKCKDCSYRNSGSLLEVLGGNGLSALVVIAILLLRSGDVETNPGPVERGGWLCLVNRLHESSTYT